MTRKVAIIGAGGFGREVHEIYQACIDGGADIEVLGYVVEAGFGEPGALVNGLPILGDIGWLEAHPESVRTICAIGDPTVRRRIVERCQSASIPFDSVVHPQVVLGRRVTLGQGVVVCAGSVITTDVYVGDHVHVDIGCTLSHDVRIGDLSRLSPGVHVSGNVTIGVGAFVGTGAVILERRSVGEWSITGAGSVVTTDVGADSTVVGVPARRIKQREPGWHLR